MEPIGGRQFFLLRLHVSVILLQYALQPGYALLTAFMRPAPLILQAAGFSGDSKVTGPYVFVSMPMFCGANESLAADTGLTCDMDKHMTWVDIEPNTGMYLLLSKVLEALKL